MSREFIRGLVLVVLVPALTTLIIFLIRWFDATYNNAPFLIIVLVNCGSLIVGALLVQVILRMLGFEADSKDERLWLLVFILGAVTYRLWGLEHSVQRYDDFRWEKPARR